MKSPNCSAETSDMLAACEWCGARLVQGGPAQAIPYAGPTDQQGPYQQPGSPGGSVPYAPGELPPPPSDASYHGYGQGPQGWQQGGPPRGRSKPKSPWYMTPWPYAVGIVIVLIVIASLVLVKKSASGYPGLVMNGEPTLLDIYTDS